jgi:hypothetical protein
MRRLSDDWLSRTIRTVEAAMERHGFVDDVSPKIELSRKQLRDEDLSCWNKLWGRFATLRLS